MNGLWQIDMQVWYYWGQNECWDWPTLYAALIFVVVVWDAEPKEVSQITLELDVFIPFFFPRRSLIYVGTCKVQMFYKNLLFSIRGFM